jgi:hypothetical protein
VVRNLGKGDDARGILGATAPVEGSEQTELLEAATLFNGGRVHHRIVAPAIEVHLSTRG